MRWRDYLALSMRSLRRSRLRSFLTIFAIVIGATGITIMLTFVTSVKSYVISQFTQTGEVRQIQVGPVTSLSFSSTYSGGDQVAPGAKLVTPSIESAVAAIPHVVGVSAQFGGGGGQGGIQIQYVAYGSKKLFANGINAFETNGIIRLPLVAGRNFQASDQAGVVMVTQDYANAMGFSGNGAGAVGKTLDLHTMQGYTGAGATLPDVLPPQQQCSQGQQNCNGGPTSGLPAIDLPARVVGIVSKDYNSRSIYMPITWYIAIANQSQPTNVQYTGQSQGNQPPNGPIYVRGGWKKPSTLEFIKNQGGYTSLTAVVDNTDNVAATARRIGALGMGTATGLSQLNSQVTAANLIGLVLGGLGLIALAIAALGVMNTMIMSVLERTREIGVMRALGARRSTIRRLFTFEASTLGFFGGLFGVLLGFVLLAIAKPIIANQFAKGTVPNLSVPIWLMFLVVGLTMLIGFFSGLVPSRRAARLDPIEALRYE
jgi:putative ABC transport system permease protein